MRTNVTIEQVRQIDNLVLKKFKSIGSCLSSILQLEKTNELNPDPAIIRFLLNCKKDSEEYKKLVAVAKSNSDRTFSRYQILVAVKKIITTELIRTTANNA